MSHSHKKSSLKLPPFSSSSSSSSKSHSPAPAAAAAPSSDQKKKEYVKASDTLMNLKFMQKKEEQKLLKSLEKEEKAQLEASKWTLEPSTQWIQQWKSQFPQSHKLNSSAHGNSQSMKLMSTDVLNVNITSWGVTPAVTALSFSTSLASTQNSSSSSSLPPQSQSASQTQFIAGRRSYGSFNPKLDSVIESAKISANRDEKDEKARLRDAALSVDDESMAAFYQQNTGAGAGKEDNWKPRRISGGGLSASQIGEKRKREESQQHRDRSHSGPDRSGLSLKEQAKLEEKQRKREEKRQRKMEQQKGKWED